MKQAGRPKLFENGANPIQELIALDLALGKKPTDITKDRKVSYEAIYKWQQHPYFQKMVDKYKEDYIQEIKKKGFNEIDALTNIAVGGKGSPIHTADRIRAIENLLKIKGMYSPDKRDVVVKEELKKLPKDKLEELEKLKIQEVSIDVSHPTTINSRGAPTP